MHVHLMGKSFDIIPLVLTSTVKFILTAAGAVKEYKIFMDS